MRQDMQPSVLVASSAIYEHIGINIWGEGADSLLLSLKKVKKGESSSHNLHHHDHHNHLHRHATRSSSFS